MKKRHKIHNKKIGLYNNVNIILNGHWLNTHHCCLTVKSIYDGKNCYKQQNHCTINTCTKQQTLFNRNKKQQEIPFHMLFILDLILKVCKIFIFSDSFSWVDKNEYKFCWIVGTF